MSTTPIRYVNDHNGDTQPLEFSELMVEETPGATSVTLTPFNLHYLEHPVSDVTVTLDIPLQSEFTDVVLHYHLLVHLAGTGDVGDLRLTAQGVDFYYPDGGMPPAVADDADCAYEFSVILNPSRTKAYVLWTRLDIHTPL